MANVGALRTTISLDSAQFEQSMAGINRQLKSLQHEQRAVTSSGTGFARGVDELRAKSDVLNRTLEVQQAKVEELKRRYEESKKATGGNSIETQKASIEYQKAVAEMNKTENALKSVTSELEKQTNPWNELSKNLEDAGKKLTNAGKLMTDFGKSWSMRVTAPILGLGAGILKVGMDFEQGMSQVQALTGETGAGMEALEEQAKHLGETTRFSATQAAEGMAFLGMAGFETNEILASMPGLLDLAASANMDLGRAADIASNIISGFNYEASEAGRIADVLAKGSSSANTNVAQLGDAMATVAPVASALGLEVEGLTAAVGFMSDAGIQGSQAGRMLRQGLLRLADPTGAAADLIEELGINVFDADGNMKELHEVVDELATGLDGMSSQAQTAALSTIFGSESVAGWSALIGRGSEDLKTFTKELEKSEGAASEMARVMQDNARGRIVEFQSALEGIGIALSEHMIPIVTDAVEWGTELVRKFGELDSETQKQILTMGGLAAAIGPVSLIAGNLTTTIGGMFTGMSKLTEIIGSGATKGTLTGGLTGLVGSGGVLALSAAGIAGVAWAGWELYQHLSSELIPEIDLFGDEVSDTTKKAVGSFMELNNDATIQLREMSWTGKEVTQDMANELVSTFEKMKDQIVIALQDQKEESLVAVQELFNEAIDISEKEQREILENIEKGFDNRVKTIEEGNARIEEILNKASEERRAITKEEEREIDRIRIDMRNAAIKTLTESEEEQRIILERMADQNGDISKRQASEIIKNSIETREAVVEEANKQYYDQVLAFETARDQLGTITEEQADKLIEEAKRQRDETIKQAEEMHQGVLDKAEEYNPQIYDKVSKHTGEIYTEYDKLKINIWKSNLDTYRDTKNIWDQIKGIFSGSEIEFTKPNISRWYELEDNAISIWTRVKEIFQGKISMSAPTIRQPAVQQKSSQIARFDYADGTNFHPGGNFIAGEEGWELGRMGNHWELLDLGLYNRPAGYQVFTHHESKRILNALNNIPGYATGARPSNEASRVVSQLERQTSSQTVSFAGMFEGAIFSVREEQDIEKIAKQLYDYTRKGARKAGVIM